MQVCKTALPPLANGLKSEILLIVIREIVLANPISVSDRNILDMHLSTLPYHAPTVSSMPQKSARRIKTDRTHKIIRNVDCQFKQNSRRGNWGYERRGPRIE